MIKNYNKNGQEIDLEGREVREKEFPELYRAIDRIQEEKHERKNQSDR